MNREAQEVIPAFLTAALLSSLNMSLLKDRLKQALEWTNGRVSKSDLAKACRIKRSAVTGWFNGNSKSISSEHIFDVARLLQVDPEWLATGVGDPHPREAREELTQKLSELQPILERFQITRASQSSFDETAKTTGKFHRKRG